MSCNVGKAEQLSREFLQKGRNSAIRETVDEIAKIKIRQFSSVFGLTKGLNTLKVVQARAENFRAEWQVLRDISPMIEVLADGTAIEETGVLYTTSAVNRAAFDRGSNERLPTYVKVEFNEGKAVAGELLGVVVNDLNGSKSTKYVVKVGSKGTISYVDAGMVSTHTTKMEQRFSSGDEVWVLSPKNLSSVEGLVNNDGAETADLERKLQGQLQSAFGSNRTLKPEAFSELAERNSVEFENDKTAEGLVNVDNDGKLKVWVYRKNSKDSDGNHKLVGVVESEYDVGDKIVLSDKWKNGEVRIDKYSEVLESTDGEPVLFNTKNSKKKWKKSGFKQSKYKHKDVIDNNGLVELAKELQEASPTEIGAEHQSNLVELLGRISGAHVMEETDLYLSKQSTKDGVVNGFYNYVEKKGMKAGVYVTDSGMVNTDGDMSMLETFAHEVIHTIEKTGLSLTSPRVVQIRRELESLREYVMDKYDYTMLLDNAETASKRAKRKAKATWEYMVSNNGLHEFVAIGLTNEKLAAKLKEISYKDVKDSSITSVFGKLMKILARTVEAVLAVVKGEVPLSRKDSFEALLHMNIELGKISRNTKRGSVKNNLNNIRNKMDKKVSTAVGRLLKSDKLDTLGLESITSKPKWLRPFFLIPKLGRLLALGDVGKGTLYYALDAIGLDTGGAFQMLLRNFITPDDLDKTVEKLGLLSANVDTQRSQIIKDMTANVKGELGKDITERIEEDLGRVLVMGDLQSLLGKFTSRQIGELVTDDSKLEAATKKYTDEVFKKAGSNANMVYNQVKGLAYFMYSGKGNEAQLPNARAIVDGFGTSAHKVNRDAKLTKSVGILASLKALKMLKEDIDPSTLAYIAKNENAVKHVLSAMKYHEENFSGELFKEDNYNRIKGHTAEVANSNVEIKFGLLSDEKKMSAKGFTKVKELESRVGKGKVAVYVNKFPTDASFTKQAIRLTDTSRRGTDIETMLSNSYDDETQTLMIDSFKTKIESLTKDHWVSDSTVYRKLIGEMSKNVKKEYEVKRRKILKGYNNNAKSFDRNTVTDGFMPTFKKGGKVATYRLQMNRELKEDLLNLDTKVSRLVGHTFGQTMDVLETMKQNKRTIDVIEKDMKANYRPGNRFGKNRFKYKLIKPMQAASGEEIGYWEMLPYEAKERFKRIASAQYKNALREHMPKGFRRGSSEYVAEAEKIREKYYGVPIREDLSRYYMGERSMSVANSRLVKMLPAAVQKNIARAGAVWVDIVQIAKTNIIAKLPQVVIGNGISNTVLMVQYGVPVTKVVSLPAKGISELHKYRTNVKKIRAIDAKLTTASVKERSRLTIEKKRLENENKDNSAEYLIRNGGFLGLVEELAEEDNAYRNHLVNAFHGLVGKMPNIAQTLVNYLTLNSKTAPFQFMEKAIQEHDFATGYAIFMHLYGQRLAEFEKVKGSRATAAEQNKIRDDVFITSKVATVLYSKLDNKYVKYLNDTGPVIFTKFAVGANRVIKELTEKHPVSALMTLGLQSILPVDDMLDHSIIETDWTNLVNTPGDILDSAFYTIFELPGDIKSALK